MQLPTPKIKTITGPELKELMDTSTSLQIIEALPPKYYHSGHLPGALLLPYDQIDAESKAVLPDLNAAVVVYCASNTCENSHLAATRLVELGYGNVTVYSGGKADWSEHGYPLEINDETQS
jgi:rhodanese-related sulfurtransferase